MTDENQTTERDPKLTALLDAIEAVFKTYSGANNWSEWNTLRNAMAGYERSPK